MSQSPSPEARDALPQILAKSFIHTGLMLTDAHELHAEALPFLQKAMALAPQSPEAIGGLSNAYNRRAATLEREDKLLKAENALRKALSLGLHTPSISIQLASLLIKRAQQLSESNTNADRIECLVLEALTLHPDSKEAISFWTALSKKQTSRAEPSTEAERLVREEALIRKQKHVTADDHPFEISFIQNLYHQSAHLQNAGLLAEAENSLRKASALQEMPELIDGLVHLLCATAIDAFNGIRFSEAETALWEALSYRPDNASAADILSHVTNVVPRYVHNIMDLEYLTSVQELRRALRVEDVKDAPYVRKGGVADGGYVMIDQGLKDVPVYSLGIGDNVSWDLDMAKAGCEIYQYDHTIERLPFEHPKFHWSKLGIEGKASGNEQFQTLEHLIELNGHKQRKDLVLKVDIETAEWSMFAEMSEETLCQFSQIVGEFHRLARVIDPEYRETMLGALAKINKHFQLVHVHANNFTGLAVIAGIPVYYCMEMTFIRRRDHSFVATQKVFPTPLDFPCIPKIADLYLGQFGT